MEEKYSLNMNAAEFRRAGHQLIDQLAAFLESLPGKKVTQGESPRHVRNLFKDESLPESGMDSIEILESSAQLLVDHSLFNGHPRFWGYITSSAAPIGALADLIASTINPNVGAFALSPMATEIERQAVKWLAELIGYHPDCGGLFVSGGNMANFLGFLSGRRQKIGGDLRKSGLVESDDSRKQKGSRGYTIYCSKGTHTWISKAADLFGHGTDSIRWIDLTPTLQMNVALLEDQIKKDLLQGFVPLLVIGNAGAVATGVVDPLQEISVVCKSHDIWFHVDGAYGIPAAALPELEDVFNGLSQADSVALDPHKWLYAPLEAGCILVREAKALHDAFSFTPDYYNFQGDENDRPFNFHEYGMQNSRGFRALKVWVSLKHVGRSGIAEMIRKDIDLSQRFMALLKKTPDLQAFSQYLSITTFRFVPVGHPADNVDPYLNQLNEKLLNQLQKDGEVFPSNAVIDGHYLLRVCIVNFRTTFSDLEALVDIVRKEGKKIHEAMRLHKV